jgi:hypothetical protein
MAAWVIRMSRQGGILMKRLLLCSGVHGERRGIDSLLRFAAERRPETVLFAGGILSPQRQTAPWGSSPWGVTQEDQRFMHEFFVALGGLEVFCAVIAGPIFQPMDQLYRWAIAVEQEFPHIHIAHATLHEERDLAVCGLGVTITEEPLMREDCWSRCRALYFLRTLRASVKPRKVLLLPEPPPGCLGGPEGNPIVGEIIDGLWPTLCVVGGPTERRGVQRIASTLVVNPGCLADDSAAFLDWDRGGDDPVEFLGK